jgi:DMSO reductase anchor subunit
MHPAPSIILFTTLSGLGYGLAAMLGLGLLDPSAIATKVAHVLALALIAGGLLSSTLHLGNPQRAWRALTQWRTSWLSREGVLAIAAFAPLACNALASLWSSRYIPLPGLVGAVLCAVTVYCTAMIYASLRSVLAWNTRLTPLCYLLFALAGGLILTNLFGIFGASTQWSVPLLAVVALIAAWATKFVWWWRMGTEQPISSAESATGLGFIGKVRLFERPHVNGNYLTNEMGFRVARKHSYKLRWIAVGLGGVVPSVLLFVSLLSEPAGWSASLAAAVAAISFFGGVLTERWLFFAEARHAVMSYYGG